LVKQASRKSKVPTVLFPQRAFYILRKISKPDPGPSGHASKILTTDAAIVRLRGIHVVRVCRVRVDPSNFRDIWVDLAARLLESGALSFPFGPPLRLDAIPCSPYFDRAWVVIGVLSSIFAMILSHVI
jgi:hypothetical protein